MPIETFTYISTLNSSNPGGSDGILQGDDHIRGVKAVLLASFPQIAGATTVTHTKLNELQSGALTGSYSISGALAVTGAITGPGSCPTGMIGDFLAVETGWLELDGSTISRATYAALFAKSAVGGGTLPGFGVGNGTTTFTLPNLQNYYRRARGTNAVAATLANQNKTHTHTAATTVTVNAGGSHNHTGTSGGQSNDHTHPGGTTAAGGDHSHGGATGGQSLDHTHQQTANGGVIGGWTGGGSFTGVNVAVTGGSATGGSSNDHTHAISASGTHTHTFNTLGTDLNHTHAIATQADHTHTATGATTNTADGGSESRPDTYVVITCIKT